MEWFKKHTDTVVILGAFACSVLWMNGKFNEVDRRFAKVDADILIMKNDIDVRFGQIERDIAIIKTVLVMKNIMPMEMCLAPEGE